MQQVYQTRKVMYQSLFVFEIFLSWLVPDKSLLIEVETSLLVNGLSNLKFVREPNILCNPAVVLRSLHTDTDDEHFLLVTYAVFEYISTSDWQNFNVHITCFNIGFWTAVPNPILNID